MRPAAYSAIVLLLLFAVHPVPGFAKDDRIAGVSKAPFAQVSAALQKAVAEHKLTLIGISDVKQVAQPKGTTVSYLKPSVVLRSYKSPDVRAVGEELDLVFTSIMGLALVPR